MSGPADEARLFRAVDKPPIPPYSNTDVYTSSDDPGGSGMTTLDKASAIPLYYQLKVWLTQRIQDGTLAPGQQIPTEQELCTQFGLSRGTVRQALTELAADGHVYLVRGRGTYVSESVPERWSVSSMVSMSDILEQRGLAFERQVHELSPRAATPAIATALRVEPQTPLVYLKRLWLVEGEPLMVADSYLPEKLAGGLYRVDLNNQSLYQALESVCGVKVARVDRTLSVRLADEEERALLKLAAPAAVHMLEDRAFAGPCGHTENRPVEYSQTVIRGDKSRFELQSRRVE
jgi:GntR family transcriptional regulator